jgi:hypothetical protein
MTARVRRVAAGLFAAALAALAAGAPAIAQRDPYERAVRRIERNDIDGARAALANVTDANEVLYVLVDRRFEPLWDEFETATGGPRGAIERKLADIVEKRATEPRSLNLVVRQMAALRAAGRAAEAVALGESVLPQLAGADPAFDDLRDVPWFLDRFAFALADAGRMNEAHATLAAASAQGERWGAYVVDNVSQMLSGAWLLALDGKPQEALESAAEAYQRSFNTYVYMVDIVCARAQLDPAEGDQVAMERTLRELRRSRSYYPLAYQRALECVGRTDEARELMIWRLETERHRIDALQDLQDLAAPRYVPPFEQRIDEVRRAVRDDPEVRALAERYGRIRSWDIASLVL